MGEAPLHFGWVDYMLFVLTLVSSSLIGIYHAWKSRGNNSTATYLLGGGTLGVFPIAMSTSASALSAIVMLSLPADVYLTGGMNFWWAVCFSLAIIGASYIYLPVIYRLKIVSVNQYLELRFNPIIRRMSSLLFIVTQSVVLSIVVYAPSLALQQVTGIDVYISVGITFVICTFYTSIGGIKAVVWTDALQITLMMISIVALTIKGISDVGIKNVWQRNWNSSRLEFFNIDPDFTTRNTVWSMLIGGSFYWMSVFATNQAFAQRFLALSTKRQAQTAMMINALIVGIMLSLGCLVGLVAYAKYFDCDPIKTKSITKADQMTPLFVMETLGNIPGLPGLYVAGVFSAALSSLSSSLNAVALVILEDFIRPFSSNLTEKSATRITKLVSAGFGCISFGFVFIVSNIKAILDATISAGSAGLGTMLGVFTLGMFCPWANSIGAGVGMLTSFVCIMCLGISAQMAKSRGQLVEKQLKPTSIEGCLDFNSSIIQDALTKFKDDDKNEDDEAFVLLRISYMWYTVLGVLIVLIVGTLASFLTGAQDPNKVEPRLFCGLVGRRVAQKNQRRTKTNEDLLL